MSIVIKSMPSDKRKRDDKDDGKKDNKKSNTNDNNNDNDDNNSSSEYSEDASDSDSDEKLFNDDSSSEDDMVIDESELFTIRTDDSSDDEYDSYSDDYDPNGPPILSGRPIINIFMIGGGNHDDDDEDKPPTLNPLLGPFGGNVAFKPPFNSRTHKSLKPKPKPKDVKKVEIEEEIKTLDDLIAIVDKYEDKPELEYPFEIGKLKRLKAPLIELRDLVGLREVKVQILDQVLYLLADLREPDQMLHTVITGPPGVGKTLCGSILAKVYTALGFSDGKFKIVKRSDLVAGYLGQTAMKTQRAIDEARGGVLFIDEAYSLGNKEGRDSFSKECIDTLNANLTERSNEFICIIAGYKEELEECFFAVNPGLNSRFPFRYNISDYNSSELKKIFNYKIEKSGWMVEEVPEVFFSVNMVYFKFKGRDMEILSQMSKIAYSRRTFGRHVVDKKRLTYEDIKEGMKMYLKNDDVQKRKDADELPISVQRMFL